MKPLRGNATKKPRTVQTKPILEGSPFASRFFLTIFRDRIRSLCEGQTSEVPVVLLQLADGRVLDLCHIQMLAQQWLAAAVYRDDPSCEKMDMVFVPYAMIAGITVSKRDSSERHVGFKFNKSLPALTKKDSGTI